MDWKSNLGIAFLHTGIIMNIEVKEHIAKEHNLAQTQVLLNGFHYCKNSEAEEQGIHSSQEIVR